MKNALLNWYGNPERVALVLAFDDEDLMGELQTLGEPTFAEFGDAKEDAHDALWAEAQRRGLVA